MSEKEKFPWGLALILVCILFGAIVLGIVAQSKKETPEAVPPHHSISHDQLEKKVSDLEERSKELKKNVDELEKTVERMKKNVEPH